MICKHIKNNQCELTECVNPQPEFCLLACPLKHGHKPDESLDVYLEKKHGIKKGETKPATQNKTIAKRPQQINSYWQDLAGVLRKVCHYCDLQVSCKANNFCWIKVKSDKWKVCPEGRITEEHYNNAVEAVKKLKSQ